MPDILLTNLKYKKKRNMRTILTTIAIAIAATLSAQPYKDTKLTPEQRAADLISRLTLEEKASLMEHNSPAIPRLDIPQFSWWNEALHGLGRNGTATVFPITMALAATWDDTLVEDIFSAVSDEARAKNNIARNASQIKQYQGLSFWTPNINIFRDPRWGRGQETYGEDPYLTSQMGLAVVRGLQGAQGNENIKYGQKGKYRKLLACAKHFAVHSGPEWSRHQANIEQLPERDLWETYLPAFKALVQEGDVREVMCAYQRFDGQPCCGNNRLLQDILRNQWHFTGLVTSDCWAVDDFWKPGLHGYSETKTEAIATAVGAGTDLECGNTYKSLPEAVQAGLISEEKINQSLMRLLIARFELGDFDTPEQVNWQQIGPEVIASETHHQLALQAARQSVVLLQNKNRRLPLSQTTRVAVIGPNAADSTMQWGNYNGFPKHTITLIEGIKAKANVVLNMRGCELAERSQNTFDGPARDYGHDETLTNNTTANNTTNTTTDIISQLRQANPDVVIFAGGISPRLEGEEMRVMYNGFRGGDRTSIELPAPQRKLIKEIHDAGYPVIFVCCSGSAIALEPETTTCDAILQAWYGGQAGGQAVAEILFGEYNPSGKLPVTIYRSDKQLPQYEDYHMEGRTYRYMHQEPLFHFGFGLTYGNITLDTPSYKKNKVSVKATNTSDITTTQVVQVYLRRTDDTSTINRTLRAYKRITLKPHTTTTLSIPLPSDAFEWWDEATNTMRKQPGTFRIEVGTSSNPADLKAITVAVK